MCIVDLGFNDFIIRSHVIATWSDTYKIVSRTLEYVNETLF